MDKNFAEPQFRRMLALAMSHRAGSSFPRVRLQHIMRPAHGIMNGGAKRAWIARLTVRAMSRLAISHMNPVYLTRRIPIETKDNASKTFNIGLTVTHVYGIEVTADTHDYALLKMDSWLRGNLPANAMKAKIRSSDVNVIGIGAVAYGRISEVGKISENTRDELATRGKLPEISLHHLLPLPPSSLAQDGTAEPSVEKD